MAVNLLHKLPLTYFQNGIEYYTRTNKPVKVNSGKNLTNNLANMLTIIRKNNDYI